MAAESTAPPPRNPDGQDANANANATKEVPGKSIFVNSEPMREDQVQNAVKFLSHPKVTGSPVIYRRSFLEKKGLTKEEIDEAFRRVPDPPPNAATTVAGTQTQDAQMKSPAGLQPQVPNQSLQTAAAPTVSSVSTSIRPRFDWSHAALAVGLLAASGAGTAVLFKKAVIPRLKTWIRKVISEEDDSEKKDSARPTLAEEAAAAAKAAAIAATDVARASQEFLNSKNEERKYFEGLMNLLDVQVTEMKSMGNVLRKLEASREVTQSSDKNTEDYIQSASGNGPIDNTLWRAPFDYQLGSVPSAVTKQSKVNSTGDIEVGSARPASALVSVEASHPKSYMEIMSMVQRGEKPPGIKEINDKPPNPNQSPSNPRLAPRIKPWEAAPVYNSSNYGAQSGVKEDGLSSSIPNNGYYETNGNAMGSRGDGPDPWWRQKTVKISEIEPEIDGRSAESGMKESGLQELPVRSRWVPPQTPSVALPEAVAAIRQPKPLTKEKPVEELERPETENDKRENGSEASQSTSEVENSIGIADLNPSERQGSIEVN